MARKPIRGVATEREAGLCVQWRVRWTPLLLVTLVGCQTSSGPSCDEVADHVEHLMITEESSKEIRAAFATSCTRDAWNADVRSCLRATVSLTEPRNCRKLMTSEQSTALDLAVAAVEKATLPAACGEYESVLKRVIACTQVPKETRDDLAAKLADHKRAWAAMIEKVQLNNTCVLGIRALQSAFPECK